MDEKKLAELHAWLQTKGAKNLPEVDVFISKANADNGKKLHDILYNAGATKLDYDSFSNEYKSAAPKQEGGIVSDFLYKTYDEAVKNPVAEKEVSPVDYYNQAKPQPHAELVDGEPQNVLGLLSPDKKKLPKQVLQEKVVPNVYEQAKPQAETFADEYTPQLIDETDPIQVGMQQREKRAKEVQSLLPTAKQETTLGFKVNPVDLAAKIDPDKVTDIGITALKYAQEKELPNEIRDAVIKGDDRTVSNYLVRNDDNFRLQYADKQDLAQAESSFGKQVSPKERMAFWEGRTNYYSEADKKLYADNAEWLSPYVLLKEGNNQTFDQMLKRIAPNFEKTPETEQQTKAKVDKEIANLGSFKSPEEKLMAYYQILANRQQFLQESMFNHAKSVQPKNIQQNYEENKGNVIADILNHTQVTGAMANLAGAIPIGGLALSPLIRSQITEDQKEWYENAKKLNATAKYIKQGGAQKGYDSRNVGTFGEQLWEDLKGRASDIPTAFQRNAFGMLDIPTTTDTRAGTASEQRSVFGQIGVNPIATELKDLKEQQSLAQGVTSTEMWAGTAGTQLAIGAILYGARNAGAGKVAEIAQDFTKVDRYSKLGKALFSNTASSKALNKLYGLTVSAIGTGLEYEAAGILSGQDEDSEFRKEMGFGSGAAGALGKWFAAPLANRLSGAKRAIFNRLSGAIGEMSEESLQTVYQNWEEYGTDGVLGETLRQIVGEKEASLLDKINNATGFLLSIALMGSLDGDNSEQLHNIKAIIPTIENITGEKVDEKTLSEIMNGMSEGVKDKPVGIQMTDNGVDFKINGKEFSYTEGGGVQSTQNATQQELELADNYGRQITELNNQSNEETAIPQSQEVPAQEVVQETSEIAEQETPIVESAETIQEAPEVESAEIEQPNGLFSEPKSYLIKDAPDVTDLVMSSDLLDTEANQGGQEDLREAIRDNPKIKAKLIEVRKSEGKTAVTILAGGERYEFAINESPTKKEAETQKTAEELDARRTEIESRLPQIEAELEALRSKPILESTEEDADMEDFLLAEQADLQNEFEDIAETRKTVRTAKETEIEQEAQRVEALTQKTQRVADIEGEIAQIEGASKALPIRERLSAKANIEALNAEKEALSTEIEALQPKKETPTVRKNLTVETPIAETPIMAETPQLETPIVESKKKEPEPIQKEVVVEKLPEVGGVEEIGVEEGVALNDKDIEETTKKLEDKDISEIKGFLIKPLEALESGFSDMVYKDPKKTSRWKIKGSNYSYSSKKEAESVVESEYKRDVYANSQAINKIGFREIAEAYHEAKKNGTNPELVKAVDDLLSEKQETVSEKPENKQPEKVTETENKETEKQETVLSVEEIAKTPTRFKIAKVFDAKRVTGFGVRDGKPYTNRARIATGERSYEDYPISDESGKRIRYVVMVADKDNPNRFVIMSYDGYIRLTNPEWWDKIKQYKADTVEAQILIWESLTNKEKADFIEEILSNPNNYSVDGSFRIQEALKDTPFEKLGNTDSKYYQKFAKKELGKEVEPLAGKLNFEANKVSDKMNIAPIKKLGVPNFSTNPKDKGSDFPKEFEKAYYEYLLEKNYGGEVSKLFPKIDFDRKRVFETAERIRGIEKSETPKLEYVAEALQYEWGYLDNWTDLRGVINRGGIDTNKKSIERMISVGVDLPADIIGKLEKKTETPVAPAAPKEPQPQPEKGTRKFLNPAKPKPQKPETPKEPTTIKPVKSGSELAEMLGNTEQAIETGKVWDRVAKMWAKKTGKTVEDWWNRIESIQVGGEGQKGSVKFENGKFIVFLASDRDVSTPVHELAHIFQTDLSESEKKSVVNWYNKGNKTNHKVTDWGFAENETSRNISEYFAEGFVEWLKEGGKTTDKAMQSVFDKFKGWLKEVVISSIFDAKVELNDDMRAIYEQIFTEKEKRQIKIDRRGAKKGAMIRVVPRDLIDKSATKPLQVVWNYFAEGGRINREDAIKRLKSRYKGKEIPSDIMIAIAPFIKKEGQKRGDIVHNLYEMVSQEHPLLGLTDQDFDSAMDEVLDSLGGNFRGDMIAALQGFKNKEEEYVPTEDEIMEMENREAIEAAMYEVFEEQDMEIVNPIVYDLFEGIDRFEAETISREIEKATDKDGNVDWDKIESLIDFLLTNPESAKTAKFKSLIEKNNESRQVQSSEVLSSISEKVAESAADKAYRAKREAEFAEKIGKLRQNLKTAKDEAAKKYATLTKNEIGFEKEGKNVQLELVSEAEKEMSDIERIMIPYKSAIADVEREIKRLQDTMDKVIDAEIKKRNENVLFQTDPYHKSLEDWLVGEISAETLQSNPEELRAEAFDEIVGDVGKDVANEIIDRAFNRILYPITDAEKKLSEHADKIEAKAEAVRAVEMESLPQAQIDELREVAKKEGETITDSTTQEERIEIRNRLIDDFVSKGMTQQAAEQLVGQYIRERSFGSKFREKYAPQMSKELRDAVMDKTYLYGVVSNASAIQKAQALVNDWYERAIEQAANEWGDKADPKNEDFVADTYEKLMDVINNELFGSKVTTDYYVKVAAALYATKLADTLVGNLKGNAKTRVIDKLVTLVGQLAELGNIFGRTINMFGVMTNVKGGVLQAIFNKEMSAVIANMSKTQKTAKDAIESVINGVSDMVEGLKSGSDKGLLQDLADAMQNNPAIDRLLEKIVQNATNEQEVIDILDKIDGLEADKTALEKEIKDKKVLEEKIKEKNKEIAALKRKLADKPVVQKTPTKKVDAQKAAVKTKYESLIDDVVSFGKNLFENRLYQKIQGFESTLLDTYKEEVINKVNDVMKNITDYVYLGNENASPTKLYEMIQDAARKEFAQKYLEKADIQPEVPINTNPNLTKTEEARNEAARKKNTEKAAQKQLHTDILDAINNDKFKASIEQYIQENREKDIRNQMRKRVVGIVNNTEITEKDKKVELRKALAQMVAEAATSTNEAAKGIKDFMRTYFDVGGKDVSEFEQEFDRLWEAQVKRKQQELIKKRLQTSDEKEQKLTDKAVAELLENLEKDKEFGHKFMEDLAKNVRITQGNWEADTAKRFREHYHIPLLTQANQKRIADMIKYVDSLPNDSDAKQGAMDVIMTEYLNIVGIENIDRWVSLIDVMFHVNNLLNIGTQWQNIKDSLYQVLHDLALPVANFMGEVVTAMRESGNILNIGFVGQLNRTAFLAALNRAQRSNWINAKTVWKTLFSQSTYRLIYNQFSVKEARAIGEYSSFMDYFAKNFAELPRKLKGFQFKSALDFIQYGIPAGLMTLYDGVPLSTITNALLSGFDMALGNTLQMGRMANILSRKGIASQEAIDLADISKAGSRRMEYNGKMQTIDEILTDERGKGYFAKQGQIVDMWNKAIAEGKTEAEAHEVIKEAVRNGDIQSEYKREWRRKMQLFADYVEQEHAAWIIADTYRKNATYKNDPTGVLGWIYNGVNTALVRNLRQSEIEAREAYKRDKTAANLAKQKGAQLLKIGAERILGTAYFRTKINIFNKQKLNSFFGSLITAIKNYVPYMDTEAAMRKAINSKGELKPNSLWYNDDLAQKGFLSEAKKKVQTDIDNITSTATANKEKVTKREDTQVEKIDNQIADKEKVLSEKIESIDKFSAQKQDAIDRKIDKRQDIVVAFSEKMQAIQDLFSNKEQKILDDTQAAIEKLESKIVQIEINAVDKISAKNAKIESKINQYVHKRERIYLQTLLIDKRIESETSDFESAILQLKEQEKAISKGLNKEDKQKLADFVDKKQQQIADLHGKRLAELNKQKGVKAAQMQEAITLFEFQLENYKNIYESSIDYIERDVQRAVEAAEIAIQKATSNLDERIAENMAKKDEAIQKVKDTFSKRIASLDFELNVAINVEKERYDRQKAYLQRVFDTDKAKLEAEKKLIADRAKAERANIDDLAKTKSTPLSQDIAKIDKRIASYNESYRIGVADETARRFRIGGVNALIGTSAFLFLKAILAGDADDDDEPFIDVVGDITPAEGGTKTQNQNQKEANSKKKIIIRALGQQMSFNFASFTMIQDLLAWGEVFDYLREKKKGVVSDKSIGDVVLRPILTSYQQALAFRDAETLNFMDKFTEPSERAVRIAANLSPIKVPAQAKQIISDFYYGGQQYAYPENEAYFQQYLRMIGAHPELISTEQNRYAKQYSVIDGQPLYRYAGDNTNEVNRLLSTGIWGKETATSFNEFTVKPDRFNVLYKEMEFKKWLFDRGLTDAINITNPKDVVPKVADNILLGLDPLPQDEFQENVVKPTAMQASDKLREMYKSGDYNGKSKDDIIEKVKTNTMGEEVAKEYLESDRSNEAAFNIGLKYIVKDIWEVTQKEVLGAYLETKPRYKLPSEKTQAYKDRLELK